MIAGIKQGVLVTELIGQGVNGVTGDYSRGAAGFLISNGEIGPAVAEITIASQPPADVRNAGTGDRPPFPARHRQPDLAGAGDDGGKRLTARRQSGRSDHLLGA
jgi:hypothetical protein